MPPPVQLYIPDGLRNDIYLGMETIMALRLGGSFAARSILVPGFIARKGRAI